MARPFFSLIIPCHNISDIMTRRIFDSLTKQDISKDELEIIVVDDNSDNLSYRELINEYGFNTIFVDTDTEVHCPGNTRRAGMPYVTGEWLFFCDQDDYFEDHILEQVKDFILTPKDHPIYIVSTIMRSYNEEEKVYTQDFAHKEAWLHGKWYSVDNLIKKYNINFKKDLVTHEDIYFNSCIINYLFEIGQPSYDELNIYTYRWVENKESITRKETDDRGYLFENFNDYITCAADPFWENAVKTRDIIYINQILMTLLHAYFYYESASYYLGSKDYQDAIKLIQQFLYRIVSELNIGLNEIVNYVYSDAVKYQKVLRDCENYSGPFIPKTSFRDFIYRIGIGDL